MTRERWMALFFAAGSLCFVVGPFPGYVDLVGAGADAVTFFVGSVLFTIGVLMDALVFSNIERKVRKRYGLIDAAAA